MEPGKHNHRLRIEMRSTTRESRFGTPEPTWSTFATVWGEMPDVLPSKGEQLAGDIKLAERPTRVRIRYLAGFNSAMRIVDLSDGNRVLQVRTQPATLGNKERMEFMASDFTTQGTAQ